MAVQYLDWKAALANLGVWFKDLYVRKQMEQRQQEIKAHHDKVAKNPGRGLRDYFD